jgi:hypothetical protein
MLSRPATPAASLRRGRFSFGRKPSGDMSVNRFDRDLAGSAVAKALKFARRKKLVTVRVAAREHLPGNLRLDDERHCFAGPSAIDRHCFGAPRSASNVDLRPQIKCCYLSFVAICRYEFSTNFDMTVARALRTVSRENP